MAGVADRYAAHIFHLLGAIGIQAGLKSADLAPLAKFTIVTVVGTILSFGIGYLLKQIPGVNRIL